MKHLIIISFFALFFLIPANVDARSGCCSHHDGVREDGCGCKDGTPLSSTCAPYYTCSSNNTYTQPTSAPIRVNTATPTRKPTATPTPKPTATPTIKPTEIPTATITSKQEVNNKLISNENNSNESSNISIIQRIINFFRSLTNN